MPWKIVYTEEFDTVLEAKRGESQIKKMKSRIYVETHIAKGRASRF